jgi:tripartite-type tricarboxylate transporter receptor subunit TctC
LANASSVRLNHVPLKGNANQMHALLSGSVSAVQQRHGAGQGRRGRVHAAAGHPGRNAHRTRARHAHGHEAGLQRGLASLYGLDGPKGMDPAAVARLHDDFKQAMGSPQHTDVTQRLNQGVRCRSGADYRAWAVETFAKDKALIERPVLAAK